ncbi:CLIC6 (predicted) [Pycnogonum litorale]
MSGELPEVLLFVKSGADGKRYGACPFCQRIFMILLLKASAKALKFKVATVNIVKPPEQFKKLGLRRLPALVCGDATHEIVDDIVQFLDESFPTEDLLKYNDQDAEIAVKNLFSKFCFFVKEVTKDSNQLQIELDKLNCFLSTKDHKFLCGDHPTHLDCEVLPKLQHVRIASRALKNFEFGPELEHLWKYLQKAYASEAFTKSCPSDQEIILHWADKPETPKLTLEQHNQLCKATPIFTTSVPKGK